MTKKVRVENADNSEHQVVVETWARGSGEDDPDRLLKSELLVYPTDILDGYIWQGQYLVIREHT